MIEIVICLNLSGYVQRCSLAYLDPRKPTKSLTMEIKQNNTIKSYSAKTILSYAISLIHVRFIAQSYTYYRLN